MRQPGVWRRSLMAATMVTGVICMVGFTSGEAMAVAPSVAPYTVFSPLQFGDAVGCQQLPSSSDQPVVGMVITPSGNGCWLVASDGGIFTSGDARFHGSAAGGGSAEQPIVAISPTPDGGGYWLLPTTPAVVPGVPSASGFALAKQEWETSANVAAFYRSEIWQQAASYLSLGERTDGGDTTGYPTAITE